MLATACRLVLSATFAAAALPKLLDGRGFAATVLRYGVLPRRAALAWARALPPVELALAVALATGIAPRLAALAALLLLASFNAAMALALLRGRTIDCGCFGRPTPVSWITIVRDAFLMVLASIALAC